VRHHIWLAGTIAATGKKIDITRRVGILDRKIRIINENVQDEKEWIRWVTRAFQSVYGYEYQGDNLLLARSNLFFSYIDYFEQKFGRQPVISELVKNCQCNCMEYLANGRCYVYDADRTNKRSV